MHKEQFLETLTAVTIPLSKYLSNTKNIVFHIMCSLLLFCVHCLFEIHYFLVEKSQTAIDESVNDKLRVSWKNAADTMIEAS